MNMMNRMNNSMNNTINTNNNTINNTNNNPNNNTINNTNNNTNNNTTDREGWGECKPKLNKKDKKVAGSEGIGRVNRKGGVGCVPKIFKSEILAKCLKYG